MEGLAGTGFTAEDIDTLIVEAREKASGAEWSSQAWRHGDSHEETEFKLHHFEGGQQNAQAGSQEFHLHVQRRVDECLSSADGVIKVGSLGSLVVDALSMLEKPSCRPRSTTGKGDLFPLPVAHFSHHPESHSATSSEDLRCFFYLFRTPPAWTKFMAFGKEAPRCLVPPGEDSKRWFLAGRVLPMGYLNSVGIAQHIHRAGIQKSIGSVKGLGLTIQELRRDRCFSGFPNLFRVYLDSRDHVRGGRSGRGVL